MKISVYNVESFVDERLKVMVSDLTPNTKLKVSLKMEFPWCKGEEFSSYGVFYSSEKGDVDLDSVEPIEGTYKTLEEVPLEYFEKVFKWISENEITNTKEIFVHGTSKGGELALLLASRYKQFNLLFI